MAERGSDKAAKLAHSAKGVTRNVMAIPLADLVTRLEAAVKAEDWPAADRIWPSIGPEFERIAQFVATLR